MVETVVDSGWDDAGSEAFQRLFRYISGDNVTASKIAMTAPVIANQSQQGQQIEMTTPVLQQAESTWMALSVCASGQLYNRLGTPAAE